MMRTRAARDSSIVGPLLRLFLAIATLLPTVACRDSTAVPGSKVQLRVLQQRLVHAADTFYFPVVTIKRNGFLVKAMHVYPQMGHTMTASFDQFTTVDRTRVLRLTVNGTPKIQTQQIPWRIEYEASATGITPGDYTLWFVITGRLSADQSPHAASEWRHPVSIP